MRINLDYLRGGKEISCLIKLALRGTFRKTPSRTSNTVLIMSTCLIGEFVASMPAIADFIARHKEAQVDLLVAPSQKTLAERLVGVRRVYTARPAHGRKVDDIAKDADLLGAYEKTIALRVSPEAYRAILGPEVSLGTVKTSSGAFLKEGRNLLASMLLRRQPKQYREVVFDCLGGVPRNMRPEEVVRITETECAALEVFDFFRTSRGETEKRVLVHTNAHWPMKRWEPRRWALLLTKIHALGKYKIIFVGAKDDEQNQQEIAAQLTFKTYSLVGKIDLATLFYAMTQSDYFLGVDSGPSNLAHVANLRSVTIFGMGPHMFLPYTEQDKFVDKSRGRGLFQMYFAITNSFISKITVEEVYAAFVELVQENP